MTSKCKTCGCYEYLCQCSKFSPEDDEVRQWNELAKLKLPEKILGKEEQKKEEEKRKVFEKFFEEQMRIFKDHTDRINLRLVNKYTELFFPERR